MNMKRTFTAVAVTSNLLVAGLVFHVAEKNNVFSVAEAATVPNAPIENPLQYNNVTESKVVTFADEKELWYDFAGSYTTITGVPYTIDTSETASYTSLVYASMNNLHVDKSKKETDAIHLGLITPEDICMAQNIYHEARGEPYEGKVLVAQVTLNRVKARRWKDTVCDVVYERYQFEWVGNRAFMNMGSERERDSFMESLDIAIKALDGELDDISKGANHYYNPKGVKVEPSWPAKMQLVMVVGNHKFYKE